MNKNWVLGIVGAVITPVLIYWLTVGFRQWQDSPPAPGPPQTYSWDGRVIDQAKDALLANVEVSLAILGKTFTDKTDSEGRYIFVLTRSSEPFVAELSVGAQGYREFTRKLTVDASGVLEHQSQIALMPLAPAPPTLDPAPVATLPKPQLKEMAAAVRYHPRNLDSAVRIALPPSRGR
jgi:hypothetical protein